MQSGTNLSALSGVLGTGVIDLYCVGGETLEQVAQKGVGCPRAAANQDQFRQGCEETDPVEGVSGHCRELPVDGFEWSLPTQRVL